MYYVQLTAKREKRDHLFVSFLLLWQRKKTEKKKKRMKKKEEEEEEVVCFFCFFLEWQTHTYSLGRVRSCSPATVLN